MTPQQQREVEILTRMVHGTLVTVEAADLLGEARMAENVPFMCHPDGALRPAQDKLRDEGSWTIRDETTIGPRFLAPARNDRGGRSE